MLKIIKVEFTKLKRYFIVWIGMALMLLTVLLTLFTSMANDGSVWNFQVLIEQVIKNLVTLTFPMCIALITGYMISRETIDDTLKSIVTVPVSFQKLMIGKLIVSAILSLFLGIICCVLTIIANFIMGFGGFTLSSAIADAGKMALLALYIYFAVLPIIVITSNIRNGALIGVVLALVYGFLGMFTMGDLSSIYPPSAALGLIQYRSYDSGVNWNTPLCALSIMSMLGISIIVIFLQKPNIKKDKRLNTKRTAPKKGW